MPVEVILAIVSDLSLLPSPSHRPHFKLTFHSFGTVATLLELIPFASIFFTFTNTVGAALWAADIEGNNTAMTEMTSPKPREGTKKVE